jgi:tRNA G26 N,N-dimethylase Trm1
MKICLKCKKSHPLSAYGTNKTKRDGLTIYCYDCRQGIRLATYEKHKHKVIAKVKEKKREVRNWFQDYKSNISCVECGFSHPAAIDFHHTDPSTKLEDVAILAKKGDSMRLLKEEISKCIPLCANCHRILHYNERNMED